MVPSWPRAVPRHFCQALPEPLMSLASSPSRDLVCMGASMIGAAAVVKFFKTLAANGVINQVCVQGWAAMKQHGMLYDDHRGTLYVCMRTVSSPHCSRNNTVENVSEAAVYLV